MKCGLFLNHAAANSNDDKNVPNIGWIDIGSRGRPPPTLPSVSIIKQFTRCGMFHFDICSAATQSCRLCL